LTPRAGIIVFVGTNALKGEKRLNNYYRGVVRKVTKVFDVMSKPGKLVLLHNQLPFDI
jgi:hypothetical protein